MTGSELRRFVGGPFPNLVPDPSGAGAVRGPLPNLVAADRRAVAPDVPMIVPVAMADPAGELAPIPG